MIEFSHTVVPSGEQMEFIIEGMRNPLDSWDKTDSHGTELGQRDKELMLRLRKGGSEHRKYMRMMPVMVRITAPLYWWKEFDTYKIGTVRNSCSTMHTLHKSGIVPQRFSREWINEVGKERPNIITAYMIYLQAIESLRVSYNSTGEKKYWYAMIQMLPEGFMMTANISMNYETVFNQVHQRKGHKQDEWRKDYIDWARTLPYSFLLGFDEVSE